MTRPYNLSLILRPFLTTILTKSGNITKILRFKNYKNKEKVPFVVYADTEYL